MDIRTLTKLVLKLAGIYIIISVLFSIPNALVTPSEYMVPTVVWLVIYCLVGLILFGFPGMVVNRVVRIDEGTFNDAATEQKLLRIGARLLGCYFSLSAIYGLIFSWASVRLFYVGYRVPDFTPDQKATMFAWGVQLVAGLLLWFAAKYIVQITLRNDGR